MTGLAVFVLEGAISDMKGANIHSSRPIPGALQLYDSIRRNWTIAIISAEVPKSDAEHWLKLNGFKSFDKLDTRDSWELELPPSWLAVLMLDTYRSEGWDIGLFVDGDPARVALALANGAPTLLYTEPSYSRPQWRPDTDKAPRRWDLLVDEMERQKILKADDPRLGQDDDVVQG
jgi:hypothetical protein